MNWWKIKNWFDDYLSFHAIRDGVRNLIKWFPVVWQDRDFDYGYLYTMLEFKLDNMQKFFESDYTYSMDAKEYGKQIKECKELLIRIHNETIWDEHWDDNKATFTMSIDELSKLDREEKELFWNKMRDNIDDWWD